MNKNFRFSLISPLDHRYYFSNKKLFDTLQDFLSEEAAIRYYIEVELSLLKTLAPYLNIKKRDIEITKEQIKKITSQEIYKEEKKTQHNIRAVVNVIKRHAPPSTAPYIHIGATSFDIVDTAWSMRLRDVSKEVLLPLLIDTQKELMRITEDTLHITQVGRTHGQFAVPITCGHTFAEYVSRLGNCIEEIKDRVSNLTGKLSGAVGAYNALSLIVKNPLKIEKEHLANLGLIAAEYSNQVCAPEPQLRLLSEYNTAFGVIANLSDDLRNLQRSEIGEVYEHFTSSQVGSSTMPQKRNPWNSEHVKSLYKTFFPRIVTFYLDQISDHQRDLTNSASLRFVTEYLAGFAAAVNRTKSVLSTLKIDSVNIKNNLHKAGEELFAEAIYILLALEGYNEGHEVMRKAFIEQRKTKKPLYEILRHKKKIYTLLEKRLTLAGFPPLEKFLQDFTHYTGYAVQRSKKILQKYKKLLNN